MTDWLKVAENIDALRIIPRLLVLAYCVYVFYITTFILRWYMELSAAERSLEATGLATVVISAVSGLGSWFLKIYIFSGRKWDGAN